MNYYRLALFSALLISFPCTIQAMPEPLAPSRTIVVGAGCFWCVEAVFEQVPGVLDVVSGYAGGTEVNPTYEQVSRGATTHAEVVQIRFDPTVINETALLEFFWKLHDPTDPRGVWPDFGPQYRSIILFEDDKQEAAIRESLKRQSPLHAKALITEIAALKKFYPAEAYHQDYVRRNPNDRYVRQIALPKLQKVFGKKSHQP